MYQYWIGEFINLIYRTSDGAWIPLDSDNRDYQEVLVYLSDNELTINDLPIYGV